MFANQIKTSVIDITIFIPQQILTLYTYVIKISVVPDGYKITFLRRQENSANSRQKIIDCIDKSN